MVRRRLAKLSKWKKCLPLAADKADLTPYQTMRMVANMRNRFCPMASKKPRFCVRRSLIALYMNSRKSVCMGSAPSDAGWVKQLRHAEVLKRPGQRAGDFCHVLRKAGTTADVGIDGVSGHFTLLFGRDGLLLEK